MKYKFDASVKMDSTFIAEEYFSAVLSFSSEELNNLLLSLIIKTRICSKSQFIR